MPINPAALDEAVNRHKMVLKYGRSLIWHGKYPASADHCMRRRLLQDPRGHASIIGEYHRILRKELGE